MALLFALGSTMFLVPALAALASSATWIAVTFFCGSIFFTSAALIQLVTAAELPHRFRPRARRRPLRPRAWLPATVDWLAADHSACRNGDVQHQHVRRHEQRPDNS